MKRGRKPARSKETRKVRTKEKELKEKSGSGGRVEKEARNLLRKGERTKRKRGEGEYGECGVQKVPY